jgi:hypothetical protein
VRRYRNHPQHDDLEQEVRLVAWQVLERHRGLPWKQHRNVIIGACVQAALDFLRSPRNLSRKSTNKWESQVEVLSLDVMLDAGAEPACDPIGDWFSDLCFEGLVARLAKNEREANILTLYYRDGYLFKEIGPLQGLSANGARETIRRIAVRARKENNLNAYHAS